jgi:hypothetical protein
MTGSARRNARIPPLGQSAKAHLGEELVQPEQHLDRIEMGIDDEGVVPVRQRHLLEPDEILVIGPQPTGAHRDGEGPARLAGELGISSLAGLAVMQQQPLDDRGLSEG